MEELRKVYGDAFLKYVLDLEDLSVTKDALNDGQRHAVDRLVQASQHGTADDEHTFRLNLQLSFGNYDGTIGTTWCSALRQISGGDRPQVNTADTLLGQLLELGIEIWPVFLLPEPEDWPLTIGGITPNTFSHPLTTLLRQAILDDAALQKLFPEVPEQISDDRATLGIHSAITVSNGHSGSRQLATLPDTLLTAARYRQILHGSEDIDSYLGEIEQVLDESRRLACGEEVQVPRLVGLNGLRLPSGDEFVTPFGTIRQARDSDRILLTTPGIRGFHSQSMLETTHPLKILDIRKFEDEAPATAVRRLERFQSVFDGYQKRTEVNLMMARLALLLASDGNTFIAPAPAAWATLDPLSPSPLQHWMLQQAEPSGTSILDPEAIQRTTTWASRIRPEEVERIEIGVKRLLSAASIRGDLVDGFIDAVVCWENMLGSSSESTFRTCGAMACLLEPDDYKARIDLTKKLESLYGLRSKVIHGARDLNFREAKKHRDDAIRYGLEAMRRLLELPSILKEKESSVRGKMVLLSSGFVSLEPS
ncbi:HEPN domain-containing protein [Parafrankia sp. BMG5.11]|uniref:HEPN domain-containing protein n=1 Tax=Parafrankia sp. BMG5.11 TaxID=222540 RepID=UPI001040C0F9|nr:HEPN domain-containing protein [Parafrankia sp. BMG5.11]TCJ40096.1 hypothetical protein E0504_06550 [Parafrankia sp. BMG5.11]